MKVGTQELNGMSRDRGTRSWGWIQNGDRSEGGMVGKQMLPPGFSQHVMVSAGKNGASSSPLRALQRQHVFTITRFRPI